MIDRWRVKAAGGQPIMECPGCSGALVDTGDGIWAHALGVEPCGWKSRAPSQPPQAKSCCEVCWHLLSLHDDQGCQAKSVLAGPYCPCTHVREVLANAG